MKGEIKKALEEAPIVGQGGTIQANAKAWLNWQNERIEQLEKHLEWANRIIGSGMDIGAPLRYDPMKWLVEYHESFRKEE